MEKRNEEMNNPENDTFAPEYRDRLRTWLVKMIHSGKIPGLCWENEEQTIFRMPWKHAGRQDYNLEEDSKIFMAWAKHSGRYREGVDKPEPIVWKTRLRCALNKMPDIRELPDRSRLDISEPYRVYQLLPPVHKASQIRRRLYKRSQSHDNDPMNAYPDQSKCLPVNSLELENDNWAAKLSNQRRNSSIETAHLTKPLPSTSGTSLISPGYWFASSLPISMKSPMSASFAGLHLSQTGALPIGSNDSLQTLAHKAYPLIPSLHSPYAQFSPASIPSIFSPSTTSLPALKQLGYSPDQASIISTHSKQSAPQTTVGDLSYNDQLSRFTKHMKKDDEVEVLEEKSRSQRQAAGSESFTSKDFSQQRKPSSEYNSEQPTSQKSLPMFDVKPTTRDLELHPLRVQLSESHRRIEMLERDLEESRYAHALEKEAREKLESERERMRLALEGMGEGLRALAVHINPRDEKILNEFTASNNISSLEKKNYHLKHAVSRFLTTSSDNENNSSSFHRLSPVENVSRMKSYSPSPSFSSCRSHSPPSSVRRSPVQFQQKPVCKIRPHSDNEGRKRSASPLDLTVPSPSAKMQRHSGDESDTCWPVTVKASSPPSLIYIHQNSVPSSSPNSLSCEDKRIVTSPFSASSESPDTTSAHLATSSGFRSRSLSPPSRNSNLLQAHHQRPGTIRVT